jgi:flagellar biosynthesis protein FliQ
MQLDRIIEILGLWPHYVVASLAVPIVVGALARKIMLTLFSALLSLLSLTLLFDPSSTGPALVLASAIGSFLIALISLIERRRMVALNTQIGELTDRLVTLEAAESRRLAIEVRKKRKTFRRGRPTSSGTADSLQSPPLSVVRLSEFSPTRET